MLKLEKFALRSIVFGILLLGVLLVVSLFIVTPDQLGPFGITIWFVVFWLFLSGIFGLIRLGLGKVFKLNDRNPNATAIRQGALIGAWIGILLALNSLNQLGFKDIVLVSMLVLMIEFYLRRATRT